MVYFVYIEHICMRIKYKFFTKFRTLSNSTVSHRKNKISRGSSPCGHPVQGTEHKKEEGENFFKEKVFSLPKNARPFIGKALFPCILFPVIK